MKTLLASTAMVLSGIASSMADEQPAAAGGATVLLSLEDDSASGRTAGAIAVDSEGGGLTTAASPNIVTTREGAPRTEMGDQTFEGSDTDVADLDNGTVVDNDKTPATAVVQAGQVATPAGETAPSLATSETNMANRDPSSTLVTNVEPTALSGQSDLRAPDVERDGFEEVARVDLPAELVIAMPVYDTTDARIGKVEEVMTGPDGQIAGAVVDMLGLLGSDKRPVVMSIDAMTILKSSDDFRVYIDATPEQLEGLPRYEG